MTIDGRNHIELLKATRIEVAETLEEAWQILASDPTVVTVAGNTAAQLDWQKTGWPETVLDLSRLGGKARGVARRPDGSLWIGALTTLTEIRDDPVVGSLFPALAATVSRIGSPAVRASGTIGGNICRMSGCAVPTLLALDAILTIWDDSGFAEQPLLQWLASRSTECHRAILVGLALPPPPTHVAAEKIGLRQGFAPSVVGIAAALRSGSDRQIGAARLCVGAGVKPARLTSTENWLTGRRFDDVAWHELRDRLVGEIVAEDDEHRSGRYKRLAAANALLCALGIKADQPRSRHRYAIPSFRAPVFPQNLVSRSASPSWPVRPDIECKVSGSLQYLTDYRRDDMLVGRVLRAGVPHAKILDLDVSKAERLPGVRAVVTARDVPGLNAYGVLVQDQPALCFDRVRYEGDPVAAVAAVDAATAARALALIEIEYELLPVVDDVRSAMLPDSPQVHEGGNVLDDDRYVRGDVESAWASCAHIVEDTYTTPRQMHAFMETEGGFARPTADGGLEIFVGAQANTRDRMQLARILALPEEKIRVVSSPTGGAFGGKDELTIQPPLALLALKAGLPVRLHLNREESTIAGWKRTPLTIRIRSGCDHEGRLLAQEVDLLCETGAYSSWSIAVSHAAMAQGCGPYNVPNVSLRGRTVYTNNGIAGAFRGFGVNQTVFAVEAQIDRLAEKVGLDRIAMRRLNLRKPGDPGVFGHTMSGSERLEDVLEHAAASDIWHKSRGPDPAGRVLTGVGVALVCQPVGLGSRVPDDGGGRLSLLADGRIEAAFSFDEFGQGVTALIQASVADALGCARADVAPVVGDTDAAPDSGATIASRSTTIVGQVARQLAPRMRAKILEQAGLMLNRAPTGLRIGHGGIYDSADSSVLSFAKLAAWLSPDRLPSETGTVSFPKNDSRHRNTLFMHSYAAAIARISVDRMTGIVRVLEIDQHSAAGPVMDPPGYLGQFEGGNVQAMGFTLLEDTLIKAGTFLSRNLDNYLIPTCPDAPAQMRTYAVQALDPEDRHGPRGIGELSIGAVAAAINSGVAEATGTWFTNLPLEPETILDSLEATAVS
ncbi:molybdopterin cofactor-binding domain-containing protein [Pseudorhodoplanes sp.]|uniref:molybdopterin cofactor-binding domain-containing protein n=1 Tax=Pseudorhodoplanes sp. TaxID=1934341 RepID=UPI003D0D4BC3